MRLSVRRTVLGGAPMREPKDRCTYCEKREGCSRLCKAAEKYVSQDELSDFEHDLYYKFLGLKVKRYPKSGGDQRLESDDREEDKGENYYPEVENREEEGDLFSHSFFNEDEEGGDNHINDLAIPGRGKRRGSPIRWKHDAVTPEDYTTSSHIETGEMEPDAYSWILDQWVKKPQKIEVYFKGYEIYAEHRETILRDHQRAMGALFDVMVRALRQKNGKLRSEQMRAFYQRYFLFRSPNTIRKIRSITGGKGKTLLTGGKWEPKSNVSQLLDGAKDNIARYLGLLRPNQRTMLQVIYPPYMITPRYGIGVAEYDEPPSEVRYYPSSDYSQEFLQALVDECREPKPVIYEKGIPSGWRGILDWKPWMEIRSYAEESRRLRARVLRVHSENKSKKYWLFEQYESVGTDRLGSEIVDWSIGRYGPRSPKDNLNGLNGYSMTQLTCNYHLPPHLRYLSEGGNWYSINGEARVRGHSPYIDNNLPVEPWLLAAA